MGSNHSTAPDSFPVAFIKKRVPRKGAQGRQDKFHHRLLFHLALCRVLQDDWGRVSYCTEGQRGYSQTILVLRAHDPSGLRQESRSLGATISGMCHRCRLRETGWAELGYFLCYFKTVAPRALVFWPLVKGNEALGTRLFSNWLGGRLTGSPGTWRFEIANKELLSNWLGVD